jgi:hypothetical protein
MLKKNKLKLFILVALSFFNSTISYAEGTTESALTCLESPETELARSKELASIAQSDQDERENWENLTNDEMLKITKNDLVRRKRVAEIFAEGCFKTANDYASASLVFQHGDTQDHYFQAFLWALRAVGLGDESQKHLVALTIDRYLVSIGKKQLFGSQAYQSNAQGECFCLQPVESSFPESMRQDYLGFSLQDQFDRLAFINEGKNCPNTECTTPLTPSPQGSVIGFW